VDHIVHLFQLLHKLDGHNGLIRQTEFFLYSSRDREAVEKCQELGYEYPQITGWIRAVESDFRLVTSMGLKETGILTSMSDYHVFLKLGLTRRQAMEKYLRVIMAALENNVIPRCHFEDITRADIHGFVVPFAIELMRLSQESGIPIKIRMCDTLGLGIDSPDVLLPRGVPGIVKALHDDAGVPSEQLEYHGHNDFHRSLANAAIAWKYGCASANGTCLGIGERTGNTPVEALVIEALGLRGSQAYPGLDTQVITEIAHFMSHEMGIVTGPKQPYVGADFNVTQAGIHADGLNKDPEIYNPFDIERILRTSPKVRVSDKSGAAGIAFWINSSISPSTNVTKEDEGVQAIRSAIDDMYAQGRTVCVSDQEMYQLVELYMPQVLSLATVTT